MNTSEPGRSETGACKLSTDVADAFETAVAVRRQIHQNPGLAFQEQDTQALVMKYLSEWGIDAKPMAKTGVLAEIHGEIPGKVLLLRGDMDALPIVEQCDVPWKSKVSGVMHACGHDAHTAVLLVAAKILKDRGIPKGTVKFMFQPAEEGGGGAEAMLAAGVLENPTVDAAVGFHVWTGYEIGSVVVPDGPVTASVDGFRITITGKGTHAATPEDGIDPILVAAHIITSAQALLTRRIRAIDPAVLSFTSVNAGSAFNIIPEFAEIMGTFRTFNAAVRDQLRNDLIRLCQNAAAVFGATAKYETFTENLPMLSDPKIAAVARDAAVEVLGKSNIIQADPLMVGEDFGEVTAKVPGAFVMLGCGNKAQGAIYPHHHPLFTIDEQVLPIGIEIAVRVAQSYLK